MISSRRAANLILENYPTQAIHLSLAPIEKSLRVKRTLKSLGIFWFCAMASVFVPMLHFVLVPGFFLAGLFFAANSYFDDMQLAPEQQIFCLKCGSGLILNNFSDQFPKWGNCLSCKAEHRLELI